MQLKDTYTHEVLVDDIDFVGHVGNIHWMRVLQRCQQKYMIRIFNYSYSQMQAERSSLIISESILKYYHPAYINDTLTISTEILDIHEKGFTFYHKCKNQNDKLCHRAKYKVIFISNVTNNSIKLPNNIDIILTEKL